MDAFSYLSVLISIILGLAMTQILQSVRGVVIGRREVAIYWPALVWAGLLLLINVQSWWAMYGLRQLQNWTFVQFAVVLLQSTLLYMLAALLLPDIRPGERTDLKAHYFAQHRWFFGCAAVLIVVSVVKDVLIGGRLPSAVNLGFHALFLVTWGVAALTRAEWYHAALPFGMLASFALYIALLFRQL
jgi:hypothetical protein